MLDPFGFLANLSNVVEIYPETIKTSRQWQTHRLTASTVCLSRAAAAHEGQRQICAHTPANSIVDKRIHKLNAKLSQ